MLNLGGINIFEMIYIERFVWLTMNFTNSKNNVDIRTIFRLISIHSYRFFFVACWHDYECHDVMKKRTLKLKSNNFDYFKITVKFHILHYINHSF